MNKQRRTRIERLATMLDEIADDFEQIRDEEQEAYDNMPENIQESERGETVEAILFNLDEILENLRDTYDSMQHFEDV